MTPARSGHEPSTASPPLGGSAVYLLMNFPLGIFWFVTLVTLTAVGVSTAIVWIGVPVAAFAVLLWRGGARVERARVFALLDTLTARESEVLGLMAQGLSNTAVANTLVVSHGAIEKHIGNIFAKLGPEISTGGTPSRSRGSHVPQRDLTGPDWTLRPVWNHTVGDHSAHSGSPV
jgi:DNA-binding CsgD family transcriptional regulator